MIHIILGEAELELVPERIAGHPAVRKNAEKRGKRPTNTLLDSSLHHQAMKVLPDRTRRGRPDIVHYFLLLSLDSILNQHGLLRVWVHTRNDELIRVDPETRIPRSGPRFVGLMESLFQNRAIPGKENPLLPMESGWTLEDVVRGVRDGRLGDTGAGRERGELGETGERGVAEENGKASRADLSPASYRVICLSPPPRGRPVKLSAYIPTFLAEGDVVFVVGGFPEGDFHSDVYSQADDIISISEKLLAVWTVTMDILAACEMGMGLL
ncbi:MAG: 16S rRNA methyltransferase [Thermoplasmata archaeon]|nr:16S rRNA methyltransferase [Thermoplasmata archaeon]